MTEQLHELIDALRPGFEAAMAERLGGDHKLAGAFERDQGGSGKYADRRIRHAFEGWVMARLAPVIPNPPTVSIIWHASPDDVNRAMWAPVLEAEGLSEDDLAGGGFLAVDEAGREVEVSTEAVRQAQEGMGCWGFCDTTTNTVHAWARPDAEPALVLHMLAHEVGHLTGEAHADPFAEEMRAEQFGRVAKLAYQLLLQRPPLPAPR